MAKIKQIKLSNFRNFSNFETALDEKLNIFFGDNGSGKTNILESISLIAKGRGIRNSNLPNLIKNKQRFFFIKKILELNKNDFNIEIYSEKSDEKYKKIIKINDDLSKESLDHLNQSISFLIFMPEMERLFQLSPSYRRNFLDRLIFSERNDYNKIINKYKKYLIERIKILQIQRQDDDWLSQIEVEICKIGLEIYRLRSTQLYYINKNIKQMNYLNEFKFKVQLKIKDEYYKSNLTFDNYLSDLKNSRPFDRQYGRTKIGPHRSDFFACIDDDYEASLLSTGQQKTLVLMILLAKCNYLINEKNITPILLLDEIASHLDSNNRKILLDMINSFDIQFFLTGTDKNLFSFVSTKALFYNITNI